MNLKKAKVQLVQGETTKFRYRENWANLIGGWGLSGQTKIAGDLGLVNELFHFSLILRYIAGEH